MKRPKAPPWRRVDELAQAGVSEADIVLSLDLPEATIRDPEIGEQLRQRIAIGHSRYRADLQLAIKARSRKTTKAAGSVNALALQARAHLGWDRDIQPEVAEPDIDTARTRLRKTLDKLAINRSEIEGRKVTVLELLQREAALAPGAEEAPDA